MIDEPAPGWRIVEHRVTGRRSFPDRAGWMFSTTHYKAQPFGVTPIPGVGHPMVPSFRHRHDAVKFTHDQMATFGWCRRRRDFYPKR